MRRGGYIFGLLLSQLWQQFLFGEDASLSIDADPNGLHAVRENVDAGDLDITACYQEAVELEKEIAQMYREIRAAKLSEIQTQSLRKSLRQTLLPISERLQLDMDVLNTTAQSGADVTAYQDELKKVMWESDAIVANAEEMLRSLLPEELDLSETEEAEEYPESEQGESTEHSAAESETLKEQADAAIEAAEEVLETAVAGISEAQQAISEERSTVETDQTKTGASVSHQKQLQGAEKLVSEAIKTIVQENDTLAVKQGQALKALEQIDAALEQTKSVDVALSVGSESDAKQHTERAIEALVEAQSLLQEAITAAVVSEGQAPKFEIFQTKEIQQQQVLEDLAQSTAGHYLDLTDQMKGQSLNLKPEALSASERPPSIGEHFKGVSGRKFVKQGGRAAVWYHVNKWYLLGPYDNAGRMNLQRVYPPQSIIDLNAQYLGKDGTELTWVYDSFAEEMIVPSTGRGDYTIFYGYTELFFEEAADLWIAVGSDDRSDLWINDMPVWHSGNQLKSWQIGEGYRKVHFRAGRNKVVFRLENGWRNLGFSLLIHTSHPIQQNSSDKRSPYSLD